MAEPKTQNEPAEPKTTEFVVKRPGHRHRGKPLEVGQKIQVTASERESLERLKVDQPLPKEK